MTKEKLVEEIRKHLATQPGDSREILVAVADGLADYEKAKEKERDQLADQAVLTLMTTCPLPKDLPLAFLVDAALHQFPTGPKNHSGGELAWWDCFLGVAAKATPSDEAWLRSVKGATYVRWWAEVVQPAVAARG